MQLPEAFARRYSNARFLCARHGGAVGVWCVTRPASASHSVMKLSSPAWSPDQQVLQRLCGRDPRPEHVVLPLESGNIGPVFYQESEYFPLGGLDAQLQSGSVSEADLLSLVRQMHVALRALHTPGGGVYIVHGDIKPSNIFVRRNEPRGEREYLLADFDAAILLAPGYAGRATGRYTPRYAAPEVLGGGPPSPAADYWSLGMVILECISGGHPLAASDEQGIRTALTTGWQPRFEQIEDAYWRCLLGGLLTLNPWARWGASEVERWLAREPAIISAGLNLAGEQACETPFTVNGSPVFSATGLAQALLRNWAVMMIASADLLDWLRRELRRADLAALIEGLSADQNLDEDLRLLHFCHAVAPNMPAVWRGRALTAENLVATAQAAMSGDAGNLQWLQSLRDGRCFDFYSRRGNAAVEDLAHRFQDTWSSHQASWDAIVQQGAPAAARPNEETALPMAVSLAFSDDMRAALRREAGRLLEPASLLVREPWFLCFGTDLGALSDVQLQVLRHMDEISLLNEVNVQTLDALGQVDPQRLRTGVIVLDSQRRLLRNLVVRPGSSVVVLRPGDVHRLRQPSTLREHVVDLMTRPVAAVVEQLRGMMPRRRGETVAPGADAELWMEARLVRLTVGRQAQPLPVEDEAYLSLVSWRGPENLRIKLHVRHPGLALTTPRMVTPFLPSQGRMLLLLTSNTRLQLAGRRRWFQRRVRTRPTDVRFDRKGEVFGIIGDLHPFRDAQCRPTTELWGFDPRLGMARGEVMAVRPKLLPVSLNQDLAVFGTILPPVQGVPWNRRPTFRERELWTALRSFLAQERR